MTSTTGSFLRPCAAMTLSGPVQPFAVYATLLQECQRPEAVIGAETLGLCYTRMWVRRFIQRLAYQRDNLIASALLWNWSSGLSMPIFVHLAPANAVPRIRRAGVKRGRRGVFCMPMLPDYYTTHQWARELKRRGYRTMLAISFWLDDEELVSAGFYNSSHEAMSASEAVKAVMKLKAEYRLGYEVIVPRAIAPREIRTVRSVPHALGWRYFPLAHGVASCTCDWCSRGEIKRQRNKRYQEKRTRQHPRSHLAWQT